MSVEKKTIGIVGAAIAGPTLALQILSNPLLRQNYSPILFEQLGPPSELHDQATLQKTIVHTAGAGVGIFGNGLYPLYQIPNLQRDLEDISCEMSNLDIWRGNLTGRQKWYNTMKNAGYDSEMKTCPRIFERQHLRDLLIKYIRDLGGEVQLSKKVKAVRAVGRARPQIDFEDGKTTEVDALIGADGAWSPVRKFILEQKDFNASNARWPAPFTGVAGIYGISSSPEIAKAIITDGHYNGILVLLDRGNIGALPLEDGKIAWTMHLPETSAPERSKPIMPSNAKDFAELKFKLVPGVYEPGYTASILRSHQNIYHPAHGSFKHVFESSERIIHCPLRQQVWNEDEIYWGNITLIGDAASVLPPYAGQGSSMGIEDATVLADCLLNNPPLEDEGSFEAAFKEYAKRRVPRSRKVANLAAWSATWSMGDRFWWRWLRDLTSRLPAGDPKASGPSAVDRSQDWLLRERIQVKLRDENRRLYEKEEISHT